MRVPRLILNHPVLPKTILFLGVFALFALVFGHRIYSSQVRDFEGHIGAARQITGLNDLPPPHFLFHLIIWAAREISGIKLEWAAMLLMGASYGIMALLLVREMGARHTAHSLLMMCLWSAGILLAAHVFAPTLFVPSFYFPYVPATTYHNPTQQLNKLFALAIWFMYIRTFIQRSPNESFPINKLAGLAALCILSALAKPSFLMAFLPLSGLVALREFFQSRWKRIAAYAVGIAIPTVCIMALQAWSTYGPESRDGFEVAFFVVYKKPLEFFALLVPALLLPLTLLALYWRQALACAPLMLAWGFLVIALFYTIGMAETGARRFHGNFTWIGQTGMFIMYVESALFLLLVKTRDWRYAVGLGAFLTHVVFGVIYYLASAFWLERTFY